LRHLKAHIPDEEHPVGYIRVAYVTEESMAKLPTIWHFLNHHAGWCYSLDSLSEIWRGVMLYCGQTPPRLVKAGIRRFSVTKEMAESTPEHLLQEDLDWLEENDWIQGGQRPREVRDKFRRNFLDRPFVEYVRTVAPYQGQGLGRQLYRNMARWMSEDGLALHGSSLQSPSAKAVWAKMANEPAEGFLVDQAPFPWKDDLCWRIRAVS
jgi:GNAT superfamily N-acetyltransferase